MISATVVEHSVSPDGVELVSLDCVFPRFELAAFNTHRMFSRNSRSSRAVPVTHVLEEVERDPFRFETFLGAARGMQPGNPIDGQDAAREAVEELRHAAVHAARRLLDLGVCKEQANRYLEPFLWHRVIVSATDWADWDAVRCHPDAQREIRQLAEAMRDAREASTPRFVGYGGWHLPYVTEGERASLPVDVQREVSAGRCAGISYLKTDHAVEDARRVYRRMLAARPFHPSPFEHVATPQVAVGTQRGNFRGWRQWRHLIEGRIRAAGDRPGAQAVEGAAT